MNPIEYYPLIILVFPHEYRSEAYYYPWVIGASMWGRID